MKTLILIPLLSSLMAFGYREKEVLPQLNASLIGKWTNARVQVQYVVDSHLVHQQEITDKKGEVYDFAETTVRVKHTDGTTAQGTYSVVMEEEKKVVLYLNGTITSYTLIAATPTRLIWQTDLDDTYYYEGSARKSAERAIYTEEFKR